MPRLVIFNPEEIKAFDKPPRFTDEQRQRYFTYTDKLLAYTKKLKTSTSRLCVLLQWGYFRATGRFFSPKDFRKADIEYLAMELALLKTEININAYYKQRKTSREHERYILTLLGFKPFDETAKSLLQEHIQRQVEKQAQPRDIIYYLASQLHQQKIEVPGYYSFVETITQAYNQFEAEILQAVANHVTAEQIEIITTFTQEKDPSTQKMLVTLWKQTNQSLQVNAIQEQIKIFQQLKNYFIIFKPLLDKLNLSSQACTYYANWLKKAKLSQIKQFPQPEKLYLHVVAFIQHQYYLQQDALIDIFLKSVQSIRNQAIKKLVTTEHEKRKERMQAIQQLTNEQERLEVLIGDITKVVNTTEIGDNKKIQMIKALLAEDQNPLPTSNPDELSSAKQVIQQLLNNDAYFDLLDELSLKLQRRVSDIIKIVDFNAETSNDLLIQTIDYFKSKNGQIDSQASMEIFNTKEAKAIKDEKGKIKTGLYKALLFLHIASNLKSGELNLKHSYRYKAIQDYLIDPIIWQQQRDHLLKLAGMESFNHIETVLEQLKIATEDKYRAVNQHIANGENPHLQFNTEAFVLTTPKLERSTTEPMSTLLSEAGLIPIITILSAINRITHFTEAFKHYSVKHHKLKPNVQTILAGLMAQGCNIGVGKIANISRGVNENTLHHTVNWFFTLKNIQQANNKILALINKLALCSIFKHKASTTHTSSDGRKVNVAVDSLLANYSFKYFGKDKGVSIYTFIDDLQSLFYSKVISASERESAYVIDGLLHNDVVKSTIHSTDMHGFTEAVFAATHLVGVSLAPRFKRLNKQCIYSFSARQTYEKKGYKILPSRTLNVQLIRGQWDAILRFMVTIKLKETPASQLFKRLSSYAKDHPLYKALKEFGRIIKTLFLLTYLDDVELRQRMEQQLNRIELANKFSKAVFFANNQEFKQGTREEQEIATACKVLIQNAIVLWNYLYLSQLLVKRTTATEKTSLLNIIKQSSMLSWQHVNLQGEYDFTRPAANTTLPFEMEKILSLKIDMA
jgi:TnpA family transposase